MFRRLTPFLLVLLVVGLWSTQALASTVPGTGWQAFSTASPTHLPPGGSGEIQVDILNVGAKPSEGAVTVTDTLPTGVSATAAGGIEAGIPTSEIGGSRWSCSGTTTVTCTSNPSELPSMPGPDNEFEAAERIAIDVQVASGVEGDFQNRVSVSGGGASATTTVSDPMTVGSSQLGFGFSGWDTSFSNADGTSDTQAGSHPYEAMFALGFNEIVNEQGLSELAGGEVRNLDVDLPPGVFGDPNVTPQCKRAQLDGQQCPAQTQIGTDIIGWVAELGGGAGPFFEVPVYNMVPPPGVPNEFALSVAGYHAFFDAGVSSGKGYGIVEHIDNLPQVKMDENVLILWGDPADPSHDLYRNAQSNGVVECRKGCSSGVPKRPFLTLPTSCAGPQEFTIHGLATWTDPNVNAEANILTHDAGGTSTGFSGCEHLSVDPSISAVPDTSFADTPAGLSVDVKVPQEALTLPEGLVAATIKNTTVALPEGVVINPGQAAGLAACQEPEANIHGEGPQSCPLASKVGIVQIRTPLLEGELENELSGNVYVLQSNPPDLRLLLAASGDGIYLKLVGNVHLDEKTGRLTTTFAETPELPFTDLKLDFSGGAQAALATPTRCGLYTTTSDFTPWTAPFTEDLFPSSTFQITAGSGGSGLSLRSFAVQPVVDRRLYDRSGWWVYGFLVVVAGS